MGRDSPGHRLFDRRRNDSGDALVAIGELEERRHEETVVLTGHGDSTVIGAESPHLQEWLDRGH